MSQDVKKIIKWGNSCGIVLPKKVFSPGDLVAINQTKDGVLIQKVNIVPMGGK